MTFVPGTFTITKAIHSAVTVSEANTPTVPTVSLTGLTLDVKNFITPAPAESTTYTVTAATGVVVASPLPTVSGSVVTYSVSNSSNADPGSITITVNDPNYEVYEVTIPVKASTSANFKTETDFTNTGVADNTVSAVTVTGLENYARTQSSDTTAIEVVFDVEKVAADSVSDTIKGNVLNVARGRFSALGYSDTDIKRAYLNIDIKKYSATDFASLNTSGAYDTVTDIGTPVEIALNVGTDVTAKRPVVVRDHGGSTVLLTEIGARATSSYQDGRFYVDKSAGIIYVYTRYFSTYSLVYASSVPVTVTFDSAGGSAVASVTLKSGKSVTKPADPTRSGYTFNGWLIGGAEYNFSTLVTSNITLTARWTLIASEGSTSGGAGNSRVSSRGSSSSSRGSNSGSSRGSSSSTSKSYVTTTRPGTGTTTSKSTVTTNPATGNSKGYVTQSSLDGAKPVMTDNAEEIEKTENVEEAVEEVFEESVEEITPVHEEKQTDKLKNKDDGL